MRMNVRTWSMTRHRPRVSKTSGIRWKPGFPLRCVSSGDKMHWKSRRKKRQSSWEPGDTKTGWLWSTRTIQVSPKDPSLESMIICTPPRPSGTPVPSAFFNHHNDLAGQVDAIYIVNLGRVSRAGRCRVIRSHSGDRGCDHPFRSASTSLIDSLMIPIASLTCFLVITNAGVI